MGAERQARVTGVLNGRSGRLGADMEAFLHDVDRQLEPYLQQAMDRVPDIAQLKEGVVFQVKGGGKRVRAALCATSCEIFRGTYTPALPFAAAIEHLQNFTLVHDDIADGDIERRGRQATWKQFGLAHGVNIGDIFVPLSALAVLDADYAPETQLALLRLLCEYGLIVGAGQSLDINLRANRAPTVDAYMACTRQKTGAFLAMAALGGGIIGGASARHLDNLHDFALPAGIAFQIKDDVLDVIGGKGRSTGSDIREGKRTLMVIYAAEQADDSTRQRLFDILDQPWPATPDNDVHWVHQLFERSGAREQAEAQAEALIENALEHLLALPDTPAKFRFMRLSRYLSRRLR